MAYTNLLATIDATIRTNGVGAITGADHQGVLHEVVSSLGSGYRYIGIAIPTTDPANPDDKQVYLATESGTYTNFSGIELAADEVALIKGSGTTWTKDVLINGNDKNSLAEFQAQADGVENNFRSGALTDGGTYYANAGAKSIADLMANGLYKKTSLILTPAATKAGTGVGDGKLYSVKGSDFTTARNSKKSRVDVDGYIRQVGVDEASIDYSSGKAAIKPERQSINKVLFPFAAENSYSTKTGLSVELDPSTAGSELWTGTVTAYSPWVDNGDGSFTIDGSQTTSVQISVSTASSTSLRPMALSVNVDSFTAGNMFVRGGTGKDYYFTGLSVGENIIYFDLEAGETVIQIYANPDFAGTISAISVKEVQGFASPFKDTAGNVLLKARKLVGDTSTGTHTIYNAAIPITDGATISYSVIAKAGERSIVGFYNYVSSTYAPTAKFNLVDGTIYDVNDGTAEMVELSDGYWLCKLTSVPLVGASASNIAVRVIDDSGTFSYTGDGVSGIYLAGMQFEEGEPTSFINNPEDLEGSEVTRLADKVGGAAYTGDSESGTLIFKGLSKYSGLYRTISISDGTATNRILIGFNGNNQVYYYFTVSGSSVTAAYTIPITELNTIAIRWKNGEQTLWVNGIHIAAVNNTANTFPANTLNIVSFTSGDGISSPMYGDIEYVETARYLTDEEMANLK